MHYAVSDHWTGQILRFNVKALALLYEWPRIQRWLHECIVIGGQVVLSRHRMCKDLSFNSYFVYVSAKWMLEQNIFCYFNCVFVFANVRVKASKWRYRHVTLGASLERIKRYRQHLADLEKSLPASELWAVYRQRSKSETRCCCNGALSNFRGSSKWVMPSVEAAVAITWAVGKASGARFELTEWTFLNALSDI